MNIVSRYSSRLLVLLISVSAATQIYANSAIDGQWKTIDDKTKLPKSIIEIFTKDGKVSAKVLRVLNPDTPNPICSRCKDERKDQPIEGMTIMWGLSAKTNGKWSGGKILDPKKGKIYQVKLRSIEQGQKLKVRGFLGTALIGRTQIWERMP